MCLGAVESGAGTELFCLLWLCSIPHLPRLGLFPGGDVQIRDDVSGSASEDDVVTTGSLQGALRIHIINKWIFHKYEFHFNFRTHFTNPFPTKLGKTFVDAKTLIK